MHRQFSSYKRCLFTSQMALLHMNLLKTTANPDQQSWSSWRNLRDQDCKYDHFQRNALFAYLQRDFSEELWECTYTNKMNCVLYTYSFKWRKWSSKWLNTLSCKQVTRVPICISTTLNILDYKCTHYIRTLLHRTCSRKNRTI